MNLPTRLWWMMIRSVDMQICPEFMNAPKTAASTARSGSASYRGPRVPGVICIKEDQ